MLQAHDGAQGSIQESQSEDEPHVLKHSVSKPIIQEVREVITPSRKIVQEIQPVQEEILTIVARENGITGGVNSGLGGFIGGAGGSISSISSSSSSSSSPSSSSTSSGSSGSIGLAGAAGKSTGITLGGGITIGGGSGSGKSAKGATKGGY